MRCEIFMFSGGVRRVRGFRSKPSISGVGFVKPSIFGEGFANSYHLEQYQKNFVQELNLLH